MVYVSQVMNIIEEIAPQYLKLGYDKVGLQIGGRNSAVSKILVTLEITGSVIKEALDINAGLIVSHHPLIFKSLDRVNEEDPIGKMVISLIRSEISVLVAHTNLDRAKNGVNEVLARTLELNDIEILEPVTDVKMSKIVVYVPEDAVDKVISAAGEAGGGVIGDYGYCTFRSAGTGTFLPRDGAKPYIGNVGELNQVPEYRLEVLASPAKLNSTIKAMLRVHPYEEVAYDVYEVQNPQAGIGLGRIGNLTERKTLGSCIEAWESKLGCRLRVAGDLDKLVERVAVCGGSGADLVGTAKSAGADVLITGDVKHHAAHTALDLGLAIVDAGHAETERLVVPELAKLVRHALKENALDAQVVVSEIDTSPWNKGREI